MTVSLDKSRLLILYTGGTIGMQLDNQTGVLKPFQTIDALLEELLSHAHTLREKCTFDARSVLNIDSSNMQPAHWEMVASIIEEEYNNYDGFIVIQGTDTLAYTATALSFALGNLGKPVVCTGSLIPSNILGTDAVTNFVLACEIACMDIAEVLIVFGTTILHGNRTTKMSERERNAYESPLSRPVGTLKLVPELNREQVHKRHTSPLAMQNQFKGVVPVVTIAPGLPASVLMQMIEGDIDGLILACFGCGNFPCLEKESLLPVLSRAQERGIPVVIKSQCPEGTTDLRLYESGAKAIGLGVLSARNMTLEAAYVKLLWTLPQTKDVVEIKRIFETDRAGELMSDNVQKGELSWKDLRTHRIDPTYKSEDFTSQKHTL